MWKALVLRHRMALAVGAVVLFIAIAVAIGGPGSGNTTAPAVATSSGAASGAAQSVTETKPVPGRADTAVAAPVPAAPVHSAPRSSTYGAVGSGTGSGASADSGSGTSVGSSASVGASRVVKTGSLSLRVTKGQVQKAVSRLSGLARSMGGYVEASSTQADPVAPSGQVTLRVPVARFDDAVTAAEQVGHVLSLTTSAHDVTGHYVDLQARKQALQRTRSTYLTILSHAHTIGATLSVQQRIDSVQQQIDQLHGELKVLRNQTTDATLDVSVTQAGAPAVTGPHHRTGIGAAWHTSIDRFTRGVDAIVAALGPLVLAVLLIAAVALIGRFGLRGVRRAQRARG